MLSATGSVPHADASANQGKSGTAWTGEKRLKTVQSSPVSQSEDATDIQFLEAQGVKSGVEQDRQEEDTISVFSELDEISLEETNRLCQKLESREITSREGRAPAKTPEEREQMYQHLRRLRLRDNRREDDTDTSSENVVIDWEDIDPSQTSDWTICGLHCLRFGLDLYQCIIPTREFYHEYMDWEGYCNTFSNYETDVEYVKYWDEMAKKIKWIEEYAHLHGPKVSDVRETVGKQALKIAAGFSHLPLSLAVRGYQEYFAYMRWISACKTTDCLYFELWKLVERQKMPFKDALEELQSNKLFHSRLQVGIEEPLFRDWYQDFQTSMKLEPVSVSEDVISEQFTSLLDSKYQIMRPKPFVEFVKKKLKIARRLGLLTDLTTEMEGIDGKNGQHPTVEHPQVESGSATMTCSEA